MSDYIHLTADEFASLAAKANAAQTVGYFIRNLDTLKLELHFEREAYDALTDDAKREIKSLFLWGRRSGCWISRHKEPRLIWAQRLAEKLGLADAGETGARPSFAEQQQRKAERAEARAERFDIAAYRALDRANALQKPIADMRGDIAFFTQPNINTSAGRAFTRQRDRMFAAFERGFDEFNKSEYFKSRAASARETAAQTGLQDKGFILRRIRERESDIRRLKRNIESHEQIMSREADDARRERLQAQIDAWLERIEITLDELGYYQNALEALGGVPFSRENVHPGDFVRIRGFGVPCCVISCGSKNIRFECMASTIACSYADIDEVVKPASHA